MYLLDLVPRGAGGVCVSLLEVRRPAGRGPVLPVCGVFLYTLASRSGLGVLLRFIFFFYYACSCSPSTLYFYLHLRREPASVWRGATHLIRSAWIFSAAAERAEREEPVAENTSTKTPYSATRTVPLIGDGVMKRRVVVMKRSNDAAASDQGR